jgi:hypothetical protein
MKDDMDDYTPPEPPDGLGQAGQDLWRSITEVYELTPGESRLLEDAAYEADLIEYLHTEWVADGRPTTTLGSRSQLVSHPALQELRQHRSVLRQLLVSMKLPDLIDPDQAQDIVILSSGGERMTRTGAAKKAASSRWHRGQTG